MPSPSPDNPGLFVRDPYKFSDAMLIVPPMLVECLRSFDGAQTELDLRAVLVRLTGSLEVEQIARHLMETLSAAGFLETKPSSRCVMPSAGLSPSAPSGSPLTSVPLIPATPPNFAKPCRNT